ncbi:MAG: amidohydrolase family protein [Cyclobacteriaceae bacterium]
MNRPLKAALLLISILFYRCSDDQKLVIPDQIDEGTVSFKNVNIVSVTDGQIISNQTVVISNGQITSISGNQEAEIPENAEIIKGNGNEFLMPGMIDAHTHIFKDEPQIMADNMFLLLANGVTTIRMMAGGAEREALINEVKNGNVPGPNVFVSSAILNDSPDVPGLHDPEEARNLVREIVDSGVDLIKVYTFLDPDVYFAIMDEAAKLGIQASGHVPHEITFKQAVDAGQRTFEHLWGIAHDASKTDDPLAVFSQQLDRSIVTDLLTYARDNGRWITPTIFAEVLSKSDVQKIRLSEEYRYISPVIKQNWANGPLQGLDDPTQAITNVNLILTEIFNTDTKMIIGTDMNVRYQLPGFSYQWELDYMSDLGITSLDILQAATINGASAMQDNTNFGTIEVGKQADLLLLKVNPLISIPNIKEQSLGVMVKGIWYSQQYLNDKLEDIAESYLN